MDFTPTDEQDAVRDLARQILSDTPPGGDWVDRGAWGSLAEAGLLGVPLAEDVGGGGLDLLALHLLLEEVGRAGSTVPAWPTLVLGAVTIDRHGTDDLRQRWLPGVVSGDVLLTAALRDDEPSTVSAPRTTATADGDGWRISGTKSVVPVAGHADALLVSASTDDGTIVAVVPDDADGLTVTAQRVIGGAPFGVVELDGVAVSRADVLGGDAPDDVLDDLVRRARSGLASLQAGVCAAAVRLAAEYTTQREQFGHPIAMFQAVEQRVADAHIAAENVRLTALEAAWRVANGRDADAATTIAAWWAANGSHDVLTAAHHVHGGTGVDRDYPLHRYYELTKHHEFVLGDAESLLEELGAEIAA